MKRKANLFFFFLKSPSISNAVPEMTELCLSLTHYETFPVLSTAFTYQLRLNTRQNGKCQRI